MRIGLALVLVAACNGAVAASSTSSGNGEPTGLANGSLHVCDPRVPPASTPIELATIIGAGRAKDGTVYVLDAPNGLFGEPRAFVSNGTTLEQRDVLGSGVGSLTVVDLGDRQVEVDAPSAGAPATAMGVHMGSLGNEKTFTIGAEGEQLTLLNANDLTGFTLVAVTDVIDLAFDAVTPDGHHVVVFEPEHATSTDQYTVFYGTPDAVTQQNGTVSVDSSTSVGFTIAGTSYDAYFPSQLSEPQRGTPNLTLNGGTPAVQVIPLTMLTPAEDFDPNGNNGPFDGGGAEPFVIPRDAGGVAPGAGLTFVCF